MWIFNASFPICKDGFALLEARVAEGVFPEQLALLLVLCLRSHILNTGSVKVHGLGRLSYGLIKTQSRGEDIRSPPIDGADGAVGVEPHRKTRDQGHDDAEDENPCEPRPATGDVSGDGAWVDAKYADP